MRRGARRRALIALAAVAVAGGAAAVALGSRGPAAPTGPARFAAADCRRLDLQGPDGLAIRGVEDIARAPGGGLLLSARDRRDPAAAGGLWLLAPDALDLVAARPAPLGLPPGGGAPMGLDAAPDGRIALALRRGAAGGAVAFGRLEGGAARFGAEVADAGWRRANDVALPADPAGAALLTLDGAGRALADMAPGARTGALVAVAPGAAPRVVATGLAFANGVLAGPAGWLVAETRAATLRGADGRRIAAPGHPDNLTADGPGGAVAALHGGLVALALHRAGWRARAASRLVRIDLATGAATLLFDDPEGALFSGATVGLLLGGRLVAGSATDAGLLVCGGAG